VRQGAAEAPRQLGERSAVAPLIDALRDADGMVRQAAAKALGKLGDPAASRRSSPRRLTKGCWCGRLRRAALAR